MFDRFLSLSFHPFGTPAYHSLLRGRESMTQRMDATPVRQCQVRDEAEQPGSLARASSQRHDSMA